MPEKGKIYTYAGKSSEISDSQYAELLLHEQGHKYQYELVRDQLFHFASFVESIEPKTKFDDLYDLAGVEIDRFIASLTDSYHGRVGFTGHEPKEVTKENTIVP